MTAKLPSVKPLAALLATLLAACVGSATEVPPPPPGVVVGVVGCSETSRAWDGWIETGDRRPWQVQIGDYGGGAVARWHEQIPDGDYWTRLDNNIAANPPATVVWWQLCDLNRFSATTWEAEEVLAEIRNRLPGTTIYASPLAVPVDPTVCSGKENVENSQALVDHLVSTGQVERGPTLPMVLPEWACGFDPAKAVAYGTTLAAFSW